MSVSADNLIWIDLEMTGLDPDSDAIIEIATIITDADLKVIAEGPAIAIHQAEPLLQAMDEWNTRQHGQSGLLQRVRDSVCGTRQAEAETLAFLRQYAAPRSSPMCGNSICQDRRFLYRQMPALERFFHYRNLDVSTVKELARRWGRGISRLDKQAAHRALDDIRDSIDELQYYRDVFFTC